MTLVVLLLKLGNMDKNISTFIFIVLLSALLPIACSEQAATMPPATVSPTSTQTPIPSPTFTSQPVSLTGKIILVGNTSTPITSSVELHARDNFTLVGKSNTDSNGIYQIENIDAGTYELWALITPIKAMVPGCSDVAPPTNEWKMGIKFSDDTALLLEDAFLSRVLIFAQTHQTSDMEARGFYAVLEDFKVEPEKENEKNVILLCKPK